ncbi:MAG: STAS domain-containing protein [Phycisphaerales bacterium]|nr:STAS domain-containing protein [Phycisphaerales bacterium]
MSQANDLSVRIEDSPEAPQVSLRGEVDLRTSPALRTQLLELVGRKPKRLIVDLSHVEYMDSSGVGTLVEIKRHTDRKSVRMVLVNPQARVRSLFEITRLEKFFLIASTIDEALTL